MYGAIERSNPFDVSSTTLMDTSPKVLHMDHNSRYFGENSHIKAILTIIIQNESTGIFSSFLSYLLNLRSFAILIEAEIGRIVGPLIRLGLSTAQFDRQTQRRDNN